MPAPKLVGDKYISIGIKYNPKLLFWCVYKNFNKSNTPDKREFFLSKEEADLASQSS